MTNAEARFNKSLRPRKPEGSLQPRTSTSTLTQLLNYVGSGLLDIAMMRRPWVVGVEVPGERIGEGRRGRAAGVVPLEWWGAPGRRHAIRTVIKAMVAQLRPPAHKPVWPSGKALGS